MTIKIKNARLSFPSLFRKASFEGQETKYEATLILDKEEHAEVIKQLKTAIRDMMKENFKGAKIGADRICLKDGDEMDREEYVGKMTLKAANNKRPVVVNRDRTPLSEDDEVIYAGCYVNAMVDFWAQNNGFGKRINANLLGVQFYKDGDTFGSGGASAKADDFDMFDDDDFDDDEAPF